MPFGSNAVFDSERCWAQCQNFGYANTLRKPNVLILDLICNQNEWS